MSCYLITCGTNWSRPPSALSELMTAWGAVQFAETVWAVANMVGPASSIRDLVLKVLPAHSRVIVTEFDADADWATNRASDPAIAWLSGLPLALQEEHGEKVDRPKRIRELVGITAAGPWNDG